VSKNRSPRGKRKSVSDDRTKELESKLAASQQEVQNLRVELQTLQVDILSDKNFEMQSGIYPIQSDEIKVLLDGYVEEVKELKAIIKNHERMHRRIADD